MVFQSALKTEFFARQDVLDLLQKRIEASQKRYRQNISILGYQSLGKTSLILELLRRTKSPDIIPIYIEIKPKSIKDLAKNFIGVLLYQYLSIDNQVLEEDFEYLVKTSKQKIPRTINHINQIRKLLKDNKSNDEVYGMLLDLSQVLYEETQKTILVILDEFHNIEYLGLRNPFLELSNKIMVQKHTMYILISSAVHAAQELLAEKLSLLFGNFETITLQPFNAVTAKQFIDRKIRNIYMAEDLKNFLIQFTGGYPFYLDVITEQLKTSCLESKSESITEEILLSSLAETMFNDHGILNQFFNNKFYRFLNNSNMTVFASILLAIAKGHKKPSQMGSYLNRKTPDINRYLNKLLQMDIISKKGIFNHINDTLFENWLKFVLQRKQNSFDIDMQLATQKFKDDIKQNVDNFMNESRKDITLRLKEAFECFENDIVELDKKRFMLTRFDEIVIKDSKSIRVVNARRSNKYWRCYIESDYIDELKINDLLKDVTARDCIKKILIALDGIDVNARLKALEARLWIWDLEVLNQLLSLFEKPRFIK
ncbi:MAG: ATP-binding protein [Candidatus Omnitrophota bacterium]